MVIAVAGFRLFDELHIFIQQYETECKEKFLGVGTRNCLVALSGDDSVAYVKDQACRERNRGSVREAEVRVDPRVQSDHTDLMRFAREASRKSLQKLLTVHNLVQEEEGRSWLDRGHDFCD